MATVALAPDQASISVKQAAGTRDGAAIPEFSATLSAEAHDLFDPLSAAMLYLAGCRRLIDGFEQNQFTEMRYALEKAQTQIARAGDIAKKLCKEPKV